jgi:hypothetical protein
MEFANKDKERVNLIELFKERAEFYTNEIKVWNGIRIFILDWRYLDCSFRLARDSRKGRSEGRSQT